MKAFMAIVVLALIACASATILASPYVGYPSYYSAPVVSRSYVARSYVSPYVSSYVAPASYVSRYVAAPSPVYTSAYVSPYATYPYLLKK